MKLYNKIIVMFVALAFSLSACTEPDDMTETKIGGTLVSVEDASGKLLGLPNSDGSVTFMDVDLAFNAFVPPYYTQTDVDHFSVSKRLTQYSTVQVMHDGEMVDSIVPIVSDWVEVETVSSLPYDLSYTTADEFVSGMTVTANELRIGDYFEFTTRIVMNSGDVYVPSSSYGVLTVTVNCLSDLEGTYDMSGLYTRTSSGIVNSPYSNSTEMIYEIEPGYYLTSTSGHWGIGDLAPGDDGFYFSDICGEITIEEQNLGGYWANILSGSGQVDPTTGNLHLEYTICYGGDCREYVAEYVSLNKGVNDKLVSRSNVIPTENIK